MGSSRAADAEEPEERPRDDRKIMNAIFYVLRTGCRGVISRSAMGHIQRRTIASTAGLGAAFGNGFLIRSHRDRATVCI